SVPDGDARALEVMEALVEREARVGAWLEEVSGVGKEGPGREAAGGGARALADRFVSLRARNFAMLQRRGLEVWRWTAPFADYGEASAYQVVGWLVARDVLALEALRARSGTGTAAC